MIASLGGSLRSSPRVLVSSDRMSNDSVSRGEFVLKPPSALGKDRVSDDSVSRGDFAVEPPSAIVKIA